MTIFGKKRAAAVALADERASYGIVFDADSRLMHDVGKDRKFRTRVHRKTLNPVFNEESPPARP